jgi:hypothetical protein
MEGSDSSSTSQPSPTATRGLTYAVVDTCAADVTLKSQLNALNASSEPNNVR